MLVKTYGSALLGVDAITITVEVNADKGFKFFLVGLPDNAVMESRRRIEAALRNIGLNMPGKRHTVNLAPADLRKEGSAYDLPIAIGILAASGKVDATLLEKYMMMGELSLDGGLQPMRGALPMAIKARKEGFEGFILPASNAREAAVVDGLRVKPARNLLEVINFLSGIEELEDEPVVKLNDEVAGGVVPDFDFNDVKGQEGIKRALEIAAAGGHNVILIGPPGAGKTMLAKRLPTILPLLSIDEALETTKIHSVAGLLSKGAGLITQRPFRSPHHTISDVALVGGGGFPQPGEISLAHNGVLFLDELPEFKRTVLEVLRQPLEDRKINVSRARFSVEFPSNFMLVASMNPCPCGFYNHPEKDCVCAPGTVQRYLNKISGPLLDRIDLHVEVTPVPFDALSSQASTDGSGKIRERVIHARKVQSERFKGKAVFTNAAMSPAQLRKFCQLDKTGGDLIKSAIDRLGLSARAYDRILKVARTIADLDTSETIQPGHVAEAIQYRSLDRQNWAG